MTGSLVSLQISANGRSADVAEGVVPGELIGVHVPQGSTLATAIPDWLPPFQRSSLVDFLRPLGLLLAASAGRGRRYRRGCPR